MPPNGRSSLIFSRSGGGVASCDVIINGESFELPSILPYFVHLLNVAAGADMCARAAVGGACLCLQSCWDGRCLWSHLPSNRLHSSSVGLPVRGCRRTRVAATWWTNRSRPDQLIRSTDPIATCMNSPADGHGLRINSHLRDSEKYHKNTQ